MHQEARVVYFTESELQWRPNVLDNVRSDGYEPIIVIEHQKAKLEQQMASGGLEVRTVEKYVEEYNASFQYQFVDPQKLTRDERHVYDRTPQIIALVGIERSHVPEIRISETMRVTNDDTGGVWDPSIQAIAIKRSRLSSLVRYAATLLHELGHTTSGAVDATREFEQVLTNYLGQTATAAIKG